jgi:hypothetical protein
MKAYFNKIIFLTYILPKSNFGIIFGIGLLTQLQNILDLDSRKDSLCIISSRFAKFENWGPLTYMSNGSFTKCYSQAKKVGYLTFFHCKPCQLVHE